VLRRADDDVSLLDRRDRLGEVKRYGLAFGAIAIVVGWIADARAAQPDVFVARCVICHQSTAQGVPGMYPPLADSIGNDVRFKSGRDYLIHVVLGGMSGLIVVRGTMYNGLMPRFSQLLTDAEIATVLNEVLTHFNAPELPKDFVPISAAEVRRVRARPLSPAQLARERAAMMNELKRAAADDETAR
jgi:mono/diheme cytochrome c family protein